MRNHTTLYRRYKRYYKALSKTPAFKKRRRVYMQEYRKNHKYTFFPVYEKRHESMKSGIESMIERGITFDFLDKIAQEGFVDINACLKSLHIQLRRGESKLRKEKLMKEHKIEKLQIELDNKIEYIKRKYFPDKIN